MKYVLDASAAAYWVLRNPLSPKALRLRDGYQRRLHELLAPAHFPLEIANGLTKAERQKLIPVGRARPLIHDILQSAPVLHDVNPLFDRAIEVSSQTRSAFYDCLYIVLAEREGCELVTADDRLVNNVQAQFPFVLHLASLP